MKLAQEIQSLLENEALREALTGSAMKDNYSSHHGTVEKDQQTERAE